MNSGHIGVNTAKVVVVSTHLIIDSGLRSRTASSCPVVVSEIQGVLGELRLRRRGVLCRYCRFCIKDSWEKDERLGLFCEGKR